MTAEYQIVSKETPEWSIIGGGVHNYNIEQVGEEGNVNICYVLQDEGGEVLGGIIGAVHYGWFYINLMWVKAALRGRGYGSQLLVQAEGEAREHGAREAYLDTFSFQAPGFYEAHGYRVFGELADFPTGHTRFYLNKQLG